MIADLDGANLRAFMDAHGGTATFHVSSDQNFHEVQTGRSGVVTSFSSAGPTNYDHMLKPDLAAPGSQILSSTVRQSIGEPFAVFDGTSMATPHVAGAAALLLQQHPAWTPRAGEVGADVLGRARVGGHRADARGLGAPRGQRARQRRRRRPTRSCSPTPSRSRTGSSTPRRATPAARCCSRSPTPAEVRGRGRSRSTPRRRARAHRSLRARRSSRSHPAARSTCRSSPRRRKDRRAATTSASSSCSAAPTACVSRTTSASCCRRSLAPRASR